MAAGFVPTILMKGLLSLLITKYYLPDHLFLSDSCYYSSQYKNDPAALDLGCAKHPAVIASGG
jgi:hypothetical protein